jgi:hypothetical protein
MQGARIGLLRWGLKLVGEEVEEELLAWSESLKVLFRCNHEPILLIFENSSACRVRDNLFAVDFGIDELLAEFRGTLSMRYIGERIYP